VLTAVKIEDNLDQKREIFVWSARMNRRAKMIGNSFLIGDTISKGFGVLLEQKIDFGRKSSSTSICTFVNETKRPSGKVHSYVTKRYFVTGKLRGNHGLTSPPRWDALGVIDERFAYEKGVFNKHRG
jgi:hypothetical protein